MSADVADISADVAVIGAGPAGIAAATRIAESGRRVVVLDEAPQIGGNIWRHRAGAELSPDARRWMDRLAGTRAVVWTGASVVDVRSVDGATGFLLTAERGRAACRVHAETLVLATGARERFVPFPGWTLPNVYGVGGAQALLKSGVSFAGKRVVIAGSGPLLLPVAASLSRNGAHVVLVAEQASLRAVMRFGLGLWRRPQSLLQAVRYRADFLRTPYTTGTWVASARGARAVEAVTVTNGRTARAIACDILCCAQGLMPNTELARLLGCVIERGAVVVDDHQQTSQARVYCVGESTGVGGVDLALVEGELAGLAAAGSTVDVELLRYRRAPLSRIAAQMAHAFALRDELRSVVTSDTIVCRCEDVAAASLDPRWSMRQAKLYTRVGMGPCQGRVCGGALEFLHGWSPDAVRIPNEPALLSTILAGSADMSADSRNQGA
ncbi:MAG: FAD/NAD(P)-binding oxidoreductase [bacterium]